MRGGKAKINFKRGSNRTLYRTCKKLHAASTERPRVSNDVISRAPRKYSISISLVLPLSLPQLIRCAAAEKFCEQLCKGKITINSLRFRRIFSFGAADLIELWSAVAIKSTRNFLVRSKENFHGHPPLVLFPLIPR